LRFGAGAFDLLTAVFLHRFSHRPLHFFGMVGLGFFVLGFGICGWLAWERLVDGVLLKDRPLLLLGVLLLVVAFQFVSIGLLGEMLVESRKETIRHPVRSRLG
jgi:uncharacterized membrane protein